MEELHATLKELQLALQTLLKKYSNLKKENEHLKKENDEINRLLSEKERLINIVEEKTATNNVAGLYSIEEKHLLQSKIDIYLKDIEKCLALLNA
jgi:regulator of replication initiation timing